MMLLTTTETCVQRFNLRVSEGKRRRFENLNRQVRAVVLLAAVHHVETTRVEGEARSYICLLSRTSKKRA